MRFYVYAYIRQVSDKYGPAGTPYYIGKGLNNRAYTKHNTVKLPASNFITFIETNLTELGAFAIERRIIRWWGRIDVGTGILENKSDGGYGSSGRPVSIETREKIRQGNLNRKPITLETRKKLSDSAKRRKGFSEEGKQRVIQSNKNRIWTSEMKEKLRVANVGKPNISQKGISQPTLICPYCKTIGGESAMKRWHFNNCCKKEII